LAPYVSEFAAHLLLAVTFASHLLRSVENVFGKHPGLRPLQHLASFSLHFSLPSLLAFGDMLATLLVGIERLPLLLVFFGGLFLVLQAFSFDAVPKRRPMASRSDDLHVAWLAPFGDKRRQERGVPLPATFRIVASWAHQTALGGNNGRRHEASCGHAKSGQIQRRTFQVRRH
jgi:hypothetical protein